MDELFRIGLITIAGIFSLVFIFAIVDLVQYLRKLKRINGR